MGAMEPAQLDRTPFADVDRMPPETIALVVSSLEAMAAHPEIRRVRHAAWEALRPAPGQRLLDAGCGVGDIARELAAAVTADGSVIALDRASAPLAVARSRHPGDNIEYVLGDVAALDFDDESFDGIWCERVLQHLPDANAAIRELVRVTRTGGRVCLIDTDWESLAFDGVDPALAHHVLDFAHGRLTPTQSDMGRTLRRRLVTQGLTDVSATPVTCYFSTPASAAVVLPMVNPAAVASVRDAPIDLRDAWFPEVAAAGDRGDFLAALTIWVATGTV